MIKSMYKYLIGVCVVSIICVSFSVSIFAQSGDLKIGFVDLQRVINSSAKKKQAEEEYKKKVEEYTQQANLLKQELDQLQGELDQQAEFLKDEAKRQKLDEISEKKLEYDRFKKDSETKLKRYEQRIFEELLEEIGKLVVEYGKERNYTAIFERQMMVYVTESIDLTDEIIELYNSQAQ
jgi:outer membrane protein